MRFEGTSIGMLIELVLGDIDWYTVVIDGGEPTIVTVTKQQRAVRLAEGLAPGQHEVSHIQQLQGSNRKK